MKNLVPPGMVFLLFHGLHKIFSTMALFHNVELGSTSCSLGLNPARVEVVVQCCAASSGQHGAVTEKFKDD